MFKKKFSKNAGEYLQTHEMIDFLEEYPKILHSIREKDCIVPVSLFNFQKYHKIKLRDADFCLKNGILITLLPASSPDEVIDVLWSREYQRTVEQKYYYTKKPRVEYKLEYCVPFYIKYNHFMVITNKKPPEQVSEEIYLILKSRGYI